jgi:hypothetical protein
MKRLSRIPSLLTSIFLVGACQQIIGLGAYEKVDEEEEGGGGGKGGATGGSVSGGSSGKGGKGGSAGGSTGGSSGSTGKGGTGGRGGSSGRGGGTSGDAGEGGMGADGGTGGSSGKGGAGGKGGSAGSGGSAGTGGSAGQSSCPTITGQQVVAMSVEPPDPDFRGTTYSVTIQQQLVGSAEDYIGFQFYSGTSSDGQATGDHEFGMGIDDNFSSCARCLLVERDASSAGTQGNTRFFATSGTMTIDDNSEQMDGRPSLTITNVTLEEVTIDDTTYVSTVVPDGDCYFIPSFTMELPTPAWNCPTGSWGDNVCDCGCDAPDLECPTPYIGSCESCNGQGSCAEDDTDCTGIDFTDNSQCSASNPTWTCPTATYGDGNCTCGCGSVDPECTSDYMGVCDVCDEAGSCDMAVGDCAIIEPDDNSSCVSGVPAWTCDPGWYGSADGCDCGCGLVDPDCPSNVNVANDCYCGTGSCASDCETEIDPDNTAVCL